MTISCKEDEACACHQINMSVLFVCEDEQRWMIFLLSLKFIHLDDIHSCIDASIISIRANTIYSSIQPYTSIHPSIVTSINPPVLSSIHAPVMHARSINVNLDEVKIWMIKDDASRRARGVLLFPEEGGIIFTVALLNICYSKNIL